MKIVFCKINTKAGSFKKAKKTSKPSQEAGISKEIGKWRSKIYKIMILETNTHKSFLKNISGEGLHNKKSQAQRKRKFNKNNLKSK